MTAPDTAVRAQVPTSATATRRPTGAAPVYTWLAAAAAGACAAVGWLRVLPGTRMALLLTLAATAPLLLAAAARLLRRTASTRDLNAESGSRSSAVPVVVPAPVPASSPEPASSPGPASLPMSVALAASMPVPVPVTLTLSLAIAAAVAAVAFWGSPARVAQAAAAAVDGWAHLLATTVPADPAPLLATGPFLLVWLAAAITGELLARTTRTAWVLMPGAVVFAASCALAGGTAYAVAAAAAFTLGGVLLLRARARDLRSPAPVTARAARVARAGAAAVAAVAVAAAVTPQLPARPRLDPRDHVTVPDTALTGVNPLDRVTPWLSAPDTELFRVTGDGPLPQRLALVALDAYDGRAWTSTARYRPAGSGVPSAPSGGRRLTVEVAVTGLGGVALPSVERPVRLDGPATLAVDPDTGLLLDTGGLAPGLRYTMTSLVPALPQPADVDAAPRDPAPATALPPGVPAEIDALARTAVGGETRPGAQARLLAAYLWARVRNDPGSAPGHGYGRLAAVAATGVGGAEQIAALYAVAARGLGLPVRLVVGFTVPDGANGLVHSGDVAVWPQVRLGGLGWVSFGPTARAAPGWQAAPPPTAAPLPSTPPRLVPGAGAPTPGDQLAADGPLPVRRPDWPLIALIAAALLATAWLSPRVARALRRRRRRTRLDPAERVAAAFQEVVDTAARAGTPVAHSATVRQALDRVDTAIDRRRPPDTDFAPRQVDLHVLRELTERAVYGARPLTTAEADDAWARADRLRRRLRRPVPRRRRRP
ncbi:transglutaminaseTgpA domain-containing protein [Catellatospora sp. NPDC049133]|uniref:transglutaminaseTgpA domain-containing protein n=1 Tax=Catellatospora sp. NPDC049133 TaxID=3155499 RepID=UPI0033F3AF1A